MARPGQANDPNSQWNKVGAGTSSTWAHQNAYRHRRDLQSVLSRTLKAEQVRGPDSRGRVRCLASPTKGAYAGGRCPFSPIAGTGYCRFHGGAAPAARRSAAIRHNYLKARELVGLLVRNTQLRLRNEDQLVVASGRTLGEVLDRATKKDPREVLLQQVHEAASMAAATRELAGEIDIEALQDPKHEEHEKAVQTHDLFKTWQVLATKTSKQALDVGIDEQMVRLAEMQAKAMVGLLKRVLAADILALSPVQQKLAQALLGQGLRDMIPDVEETQTYVLKVDGEELPYNAAMDKYAGALDNVKKDSDKLNHAAYRSRMREEQIAARRQTVQDEARP